MKFQFAVLNRVPQFALKLAARFLRLQIHRHPDAPPCRHSGRT